jgi:hypothetical protein
VARGHVQLRAWRTTPAEHRIGAKTREKIAAAQRRAWAARRAACSAASCSSSPPQAKAVPSDPRNLTSKHE